MPLKLRAEDQSDLAIISAAVQDAIIRVGDLRYDPVGRSLTLRLSRYQNETSTGTRIEAGLRIDSVMRMQSMGFDRSNPDAFAVILNLTFEPIDAPEGTLSIHLAGGGVLKATVECLDIILLDIGSPRKTSRTPDHDHT